MMLHKQPKIGAGSVQSCGMKNIRDDSSSGLHLCTEQFLTLIILAVVLIYSCDFMMESKYLEVFFLSK